MTEAKHTPGPWEWWTSCSWKRLTSKDANGRWLREGNVLCPAIASDGHPVLNVSEDDMALIAAAPDLLAALKVVAGSENWRCFAENEWDIVNAAIAKAEGRTPAAESQP